MTEKEMAEEWIKDYSGLIVSYKFVKYDYDDMQNAFLAGLKAGKVKEEAKNIIQDLLSNSDEYARQRAIDFLKEVKGDNN